MSRPLPILLLLLSPMIARAAPAGDNALRPDTLHSVHLTLTKQAWDAMQPGSRNLIAGLFASTRPVDEEPRKFSPFGYGYAFVHADVDYDGQLVPDVGLRFKGNSSYMFGKEIKKPFKIDFNHFDAKSLDGLTSLNLSNDAFDPTYMRERLTFAVFRDAGAPAPRTAYALVYLTVPGLHDHKLAGLYTVIEEVNKPFLKRTFGNDRGLLLKPENAFDLPYLGNDPAKYDKIYRPKTDKNIPPAAWQRLFDFLQLIHNPDDAAFDKNIDTYLDVDSYLRFIAVNALTANMDSFLSTGHNFYLYVHPETLKIHFIPWDTNLAFGLFDWVGSTKEQTELSIRQPYVKANTLTQRLLKNERFAKPYRREIDRLTQTAFNLTHLTARIEALERLIADAYRAAKLSPATRPTTLPIKADLRTFIQLRYASVRAQRDGASDGYTPHWVRGWFGGNAATQPAAAATTQPSEKR